MTNNIEGKVVVITGASSCLGEATAEHLASKGATIVLGARSAYRRWRSDCPLTAARLRTWPRTSPVESKWRSWLSLRWKSTAVST